MNKSLFPIASLEDLISEASEIVAKAKETFNPVATFALFSGGNDSTAMLHLIKSQVDAAVHINTGIGIPETSQFVRKTCEELNLKLIELRTSPDIYRDIVLGPTRQGFPGPAFHYICYHRLKSERLQNLQRDYSKRGQKILLVSGVRSSESRRRMLNIGAKKIDPPRGRLSRCAWANPLLDFDSSHLANYRLERSIEQGPGPLFLHRSGECLCGAFANKDELKEVEFWFPHTGKEIRGLEREAENLGKPFCKWGWGHDRPEGRRPGPLCSSCTLSLPFPEPL